MGCHFLLQGSPQPRDQTCVSYIFCIGRRVLYHWATREAHSMILQDFFFLIYIYFIELSTVCKYFNLRSVENFIYLPLDYELTELHEGWNSVCISTILNLCPHMEPESWERTWLPPFPKPISGPSCYWKYYMNNNCSVMVLWQRVHGIL